MRRFEMDKIVCQSCYVGRDGDGKTCAICGALHLLFEIAKFNFVRHNNQNKKC